MYNISEEESNRINILKFISIIFVVYIHSYATTVNFASGTNDLFLPLWLDCIEYGISQVIARCGVPIFFIISSILLFKKERKYLPTIKNKIKTLLIPYVIWNTIWIIAFIILQNLPFTSEYFSGSHTPILKSSFKEWLALYGIGQYPQDYPLWFIRDLMVITLFYPLIQKISKNHPKFMLFFGILLIFIPFEFPFKTCLQYFLIGSALVYLNIHINCVDKINFFIIVFAYLLSAILNIIARNFYISNITIILGIIFWIKITKIIYNNIKLRNVFLNLSKYTFIIYVFHELTLSSVKKICLKLFPAKPIVLLIEYITIPLLIVGICILLYKILYNLAPKIYKISTGER